MSGTEHRLLLRYLVDPKPASLTGCSKAYSRGRWMGTVICTGTLPATFVLTGSSPFGLYLTGASS